jgi:mRNA interferase RelE/StbE
MGRYKIIFRKSVAKDLQPIPNKDLKRILAVIDSLSRDPRPSGFEKLSGENKCRMRQGDYRIVYEIRDSESAVVVVKIGHRRELYRHIGSK